jgi:hypothetical protein
MELLVIYYSFPPPFPPAPPPPLPPALSIMRFVVFTRMLNAYVSRHSNVQTVVLNVYASCFPRLVKVKSKTIPVTGHVGTYGCETSSISLFLGNLLTGGLDYHLTRRLRFTPR